MNWEGDRQEMRSAAAALGYLAATVERLGFYLDIPLRYPIKPGNSKTLILSHTGAAGTYRSATTFLTPCPACTRVCLSSCSFSCWQKQVTRPHIIYKAPFSICLFPIALLTCAVTLKLWASGNRRSQAVPKSGHHLTCPCACWAQSLLPECFCTDTAHVSQAAVHPGCRRVSTSPAVCDSIVSHGCNANVKVHQIV